MKTTSTFINSCSAIPSLHSARPKLLLSNGLFPGIGNSRRAGLLSMFTVDLGRLVPIQAAFRKRSVFLVLGNERGKVVFQPSSLVLCSFGNCVSPRGVERVLREGLWCLRVTVLLLDVGFGQRLVWVSRGLTPLYLCCYWVWGAPVQLGCKLPPSGVPACHTTAGASLGLGTVCRGRTLNPARCSGW